MPSNYSNARRFTRFSAEALDLSGELCGISGVKLRDFSIGGASFVLSRPLSAKRICTLDIMAGDEVFSLEGTVVWSRNLGDRGDRLETGDGTANSYTVGFRFDSDKFSVASSMIYNLLNS